MKNTEDIHSLLGDPLGIRALASAVDALRSAAQNDGAENREALPDLVARLETAHRDFSIKMDLLRDRYCHLKKTSAQLAEELTWLRDQLDDLNSAEESAALPPPKNGAGTEQRRYADRWRRVARHD
jgi:hypothetical protein